MWMGTRSGYLFLLDASAIENQEQETAIKGFQYCGDGHVKGITPFPSSLKVSLYQKTVIQSSPALPILGCIFKAN